MSHIVDLQAPWQRAIRQTLEIQQRQQKSQRRLSRISAVLVAYGDPQQALASVVSLLAEDLVRELIVVNCIRSAAFEQPLHKIAHTHTRVHITSGTVSMGLAAAYNLGRRQTTSQYVFYAHTPIILPNQMITQMMEMGTAQSSSWLVGVRHNGTYGFDPFFRTDNNQRHHGASVHSDVELVATVQPTCFILSQALLLELGGFDEQCIEDNLLLDLCLKVHLVGGEVVSARRFLLSGSPCPLTDHWRVHWHSWDHYYRRHFKSFYNLPRKLRLFFKLVSKIFYKKLLNGLAKI